MASFHLSKRLCFYVSLYIQKLSLDVNKMSLLCPSFLHVLLLACHGSHHVHMSLIEILIEYGSHYIHCEFQGIN